MAARSSGWAAARGAMTKNVALSEEPLSAARIAGVHTGSGPSSKVSSTEPAREGATTAGFPGRAGDEARGQAGGRWSSRSADACAARAPGERSHRTECSQFRSPDARRALAERFDVEPGSVEPGARG